MRKRKPVLLNGEALMVDGKALEFDAVNQEELDGKIDAPQVAQVGEVLTVEEVGEDGKPKKWKTQAVQTEPPDWNENEPTKSGYIENRTHYFKVTKTEIGSILFKAISSSALVMENPEDTKLVRAGITKVANEHSNIVEAIVNGNPYKFYVKTTMGVTMLMGVDDDSNGWAYDGPAGMNQQFRIGENVSLVVGNTYNVMFYWRNEFCKTLDEMYFPKTIFTQNNSPVKFGANEHGDIIESTIQGFGTVAQGIHSHAEGTYTKALGDSSHAEGNSTKAQKSSSHAEGYMTTANGESAHAEGFSTQANHREAHAEGDHAIASGECSHAEGKYTIASGKVQHAQGKYNIEDTVSANIVGNGESDSKRSNAYTLDWEGNAWFAGDVYVHSTSGTNKDDGSKKLLDTSDLLAFAEEVKDVTIQKPTTAQVGQIVKVKAVDADGKITETEAVDMPTVPNDYELVFQETVAEDVIAYSRDTDKDGNPFSLTDVMVIIFTKPFAESTNSGGRSLGFLPTSRWGHDNVSCEIGSSISSANTNSVGRYNVVFAKVVNGYQVVTRAYESQNTTNVFGVLVRQTKANNEMFAFHSDSTKLMQIASPQGNITCVKIVGYTNPLVSAGTIVALYKRKGT